jgi:hypothetical protein
MGVGGQRHIPATLRPCKWPVTHCKGGWVGPRAGLDRCTKYRSYRDSIPPTFQLDSSELNNSEFRDTTTIFESPPQKMSPLPGFDPPTQLFGTKQFGIQWYNHNFWKTPAENVAPTGIRSPNPTLRNKTIRNSEIQSQFSNVPSPSRKKKNPSVSVRCQICWNRSNAMWCNEATRNYVEKQDFVLY